MRRLLIVLLLTAACRTTTLAPVAAHREFRIIGYVTRKADLTLIGAQKLTHINYAFAKVNPIGLAEFEDRDAPALIAKLQALKARNPNLKIIVSIGGWGANYFSDAALTEASRCNFVASTMEMLKRYGLDGIDLDWEYPGDPGPGMIFRVEDKENFTALLKMFREELDALSDARGRTGFDRYTLSIASAGGPSYFEHTEIAKLHPYIDWFNVMTYDFAGEWSTTTAHHTALYRSASASPKEASSDAYIQQYLAAGVPSRKLVLGAAFYGRSWIRASRKNGGLYQQFDRYDTELAYSRLINEPGLERRWDKSAQAPYLWSAETGRFITYDDPQSLRAKAAFVRKHHLGGIMYWEHSHDPHEVLLDAIYASLH